ncbi:MAG TPA: bifunctional [glutamate--ammonia ligase]-adenylyl-L-tyrosine phosphorylase/[glutamate--ammonia-ligase] adenylyltransferase [Candidatus Binatus sp.]|nr:bifunctional [glutamate--ammonia ligase]-adenylyl-L-tyrosine phosphorylase/[glutamate--ammonia-ligase] adenylyltransferase [Candidatus Binatus sp.]
MDRGNRWIREKAAASLNPSLVETTLVELSEKWAASAPAFVDVVEEFSLGEAALLHLLAVSDVCATRLIRNPETVLWLGRPEVCLAARGYGEMFNDLLTLAGNSIAAENFALLRFWKGREMTRIALRELANVAPLEETTGELSQIAEICIRRVFEHWNGEFRRRHGSPDTEFAILALGKLGGGELNHSSDVDLLFLYSDEGQLSTHLSYHEFFNRLGKKILETFSAPHPEGSLFRVDLRLRPEGSAGPLARSLESMENYYAGFGETWERLALIKARGIGGSRELAYEFLRQHQPFIYPKSPTPDLLDEIARIKRRIERDVVGADKLERDVKLGTGGIREIEFVVQALQLIHGSHHPFLQESSTFKALRGLRQLDLLPREEVLTLDKAYRFLRRVEHRLQIEAEQQTHTVPQEPNALRRLALSLRFSSEQDFTAVLRQHMRAVRSIFERVITEAHAEPTHPDRAIFSDQKRAAKALADLAQGPTGFHIAPRTRQIFRKLRPVLLEWLTRSADPDTSLNQFVRFVEAYGLRSLLFELLVTNPRLLELLVKTFDASRFASELLIRRPQLFEEITRGEQLDQAITLEGHLRRLSSLDLGGASFDAVRAYRQTQLLRILLRDVLSLSALAGPQVELAALAEACLLFMANHLGGDQLTIIALGKYGGREISYGADLDVVFVGDDIRAAQNLIVTMAQPTAEGNIWVLDARLRPEGEKGPLVCSLETYQSYYASRAQPWELQALTRARTVTGPLQNEFIEIAKRAWDTVRQHVDLGVRIDNMLERIRRERGSGSDFLDFKTGTGGVIEGEFFVQALQMREDIWEPNWGRAVDRLRETGSVTDSETAKLKNAYAFLRRCESVLRRFDNKSISAFPSDPSEQRKLAIRLGHQDLETFCERYVDARESIHALYNRHIKDASN